MSRISSWAFLTLFAALPTLASAQPSLHGRTTWISHYRAIGGQHVGDTTLVLDGGQGHYSNRYVQGQLYNIAYEFLPNGDWLAIGEWRSGGYSGTFQFRSEHGKPDAFRGSYTVYGRADTFYWNGRHVSDARPVHRSGCTYGPWRRDADTGLYTRTCHLPGGGYQLLVFWEGRPDWIFWYNPAKGLYWCACPTESHPLFGNRITAGETLFLVCQVKSQRLSQVVLQPESETSSQMSAANSKGENVDLDNVPSDKPLL